MCASRARSELAEMSWTGRLPGAKSRARAGRKLQRKPQLQNGALKPYLVPEVGTHDRKVVFCETSYYFMLKVIGGSCNGVPVTFLVRPTAFLDRFFQSVVEILILPAFRSLGLSIEFDLVDQQAGKTLGLAMNFLILGRDRGNRRRLGRCLGLGMTDRERLGQRRVQFNNRGLNFGDRALGFGSCALGRRHWNWNWSLNGGASD